MKVGFTSTKLSQRYMLKEVLLFLLDKIEDFVDEEERFHLSLEKSRKLKY